MYLHPTWGALYWPIGLVVTALLFFPPETYAFFTGHANTLSDYARWQLNEYPNEPLFAHDWQWWLSQVVYLGAIEWLWGHIWYYIWG